MFDQELAYFQQHRDELLQHHAGQFVLIKGDRYVGAYTTESEAYAAGVKEFGNVSFLIKQALAKDETVWIPVLNLGLT